MACKESNDSFCRLSGIKEFLSNHVIQVLLVVFTTYLVILFYSFPASEDFEALSKEAYKLEKRYKQPTGNPEENEDMSQERKKKQEQAAKDQALKHAEEFSNDFHILFIFSKVKDNVKLQKKFNIAFGSLFKHAKFETHETLHLHFVCDDAGREFVEDHFQKHILHPSFLFKVHFHNVSAVTAKILPDIGNLQTSLGQKHPYYEDSIFFLSLTLHKVLPDYIHRVVQLDVDLKFVVNIRDLWDEFSYFTRDNLIGIAYENQPVYRHILWKYRQDHPGTQLGNPPPDGHPGFNSGVMLLHLDHLRSSSLYNSYIDGLMVGDLVKKFSFKGHLGDQDFFTLLSFEQPQLFYHLPCTWNRQLCQWWKNKGYEQIFNEYFACSGDVKIWHGNCDTPIA